MKKKISLAIALFFCLISFATPLLAAQSWDDLVAGMQQQEDIKQKGAGIVDQLRAQAPVASETQLWNALWVGDTMSRATAGVALMDKIFPGGDPSKWEQVQGFLSNTSYQPRQLAALDGLFVAVASLNAIPNGEWGAAYLLSQFGKSGRGKVYFIEEVPAEFRPVIDSVVSKTGLRGDWSTVRSRGRMPLLPVYRGIISRNGVESRQMQYFDGFGSMANNGRYAWDRDRGYFYQVVEDSSFFIPSFGF
ncbi:hypothetical protein LJC40_01310 [Synergistaceae bacterium OttesenSCG-928-D05]|nr:hypothetical protein [Synergistaceae bacterium OttesenSCG-928-D05]